MVALAIEGFDKYGPAGQTLPTVSALLAAEAWTPSVYQGSIAIVAGLSSPGWALALNSNIGNGYARIGRNIVNSARLIGGVRFTTTTLTATIPAYVQFTDAGTAQCTITMNPTTGTFSLRTGGTAGAALATSVASIVSGAAHYLEWDITFGAAGAYQLWLDGVPLFSAGLTGNTKTTANAYANNIVLSSENNNGMGTLVVDDFYLFDATGATNNAVLLTNPIVETQFPTGDAQTQWANGAMVLGQDYSTVVSGAAPGANQVFLRAFTAPVNMTLLSVSCRAGSTSGTAKFKAVLYAGITAGSAVIATGTEVVGTTSGATLTAPFAAGQALAAGVTYAIGFITDTSVVLSLVDTTLTGSRAANTYASGAPGTLPAMTTGQASWGIWGNCSGSAVNWPSLSSNPPLDDLAYVTSSTPGQEDLYSFPALSSNPAAIYTVAVKARVKRSDSGVRTVDVRCSSGGSDSAGSASGFTPGTTYSWLDTFLPLDPNTGIAWTGSGVNAAKGGVKVAS